MKNKRSYRIERIDHLVLTVASIEATIAFYETVREMTSVRFGVDNQRVAVKFGEQRINLHEVGRGFEPKAGRPTAGSANLCFIVDDFASVAAQLTACGIEIFDQDACSGALGDIQSIYFRDPDNNLIEVSVYGQG